MKCPYCGATEDKVIDSRETSDAAAIRRRRECVACQRRFTTYEHPEESSLLVVKRDGRREPFDRKKISSGIIKACEKRPIPMEQIETLVDQIERAISGGSEKEISSVEIGEKVMQALQNFDEVAYVRFASVYRSFKDINQFMRELREILDSKDRSKN